MSRKNGRQFFSKKNDGTTTLQDLHSLEQDVVDFLHALPGHIKKWISEATDIVDFVEKVNEATAAGMPLDQAIQFVLEAIPGSVDDMLYEKLKAYLMALPGIVRKGKEKLAIASDFLSHISGLNEIEADTATQVAVYIYKKQGS